MVHLDFYAMAAMAQRAARRKTTSQFSIDPSFLSVVIVIVFGLIVVVAIVSLVRASRRKKGLGGSGEQVLRGSAVQLSLQGGEQDRSTGTIPRLPLVVLMVGLAAIVFFGLGVSLRAVVLVLIVGAIAAIVSYSLRRRRKPGEHVLGANEVQRPSHGRQEREATEDNKATYLPVRIAGVELNAADETKHFLFAGSTGTGKTQGINQVLNVIRARKARAIVADAGGSAVSAFYQPGDLILNPFDRRSVDWSPFAELRCDFDRSRLAKAAIPDTEGESREWHVYAQTLLAEVIGVMHKQNDHSTKELVRLVMSADRKELSQLLKGTAAEMLSAPESDRMLANTRAIASAFLVAWLYLSDNGRFSLREWVHSDADSRWCFVTYREDQFEMLRYLIATMLDLAVVETLSLSEDKNRQIWFIMDEVDSLGKIPSLQYALTKLRKYGGRCVLGLQTISQLAATYGDHEAQTLMANVGTKIVLRAGDGETADYFSREFGEQEIERPELSVTKGTTGSRTTTERRETRRTVLGSELTGLPDLQGYLKTPGSLMRIQLQYEKVEKKVESFVGVESGAAPSRGVGA